MYKGIIEGINELMPAPNFIWGIVFMISVAILIVVFLLFCHRFINARRRALLPVETTDTEKILGSSDLEQQMLNLSYVHRNVKWKKYNFVIRDRNDIAYKKLNKIRDTLSGVSPEIIALVPAARWLFDNFQIMYRELKKIKAAETSDKILPILQEGEFKGYPRIYVLARKIVKLSGGYLNEDKISLMVKAYQKELSLTDTELWALPEIISFCLLESITSVAEDIINITETKFKADLFVKNSLKEQGNTISIDPLLKGVEEKYSKNISFHSYVVYLLKNMGFDDSSIQRYVECYFNETKYSKPSDIFLDEGKLESYLESNIRIFLASLWEVSEIDGVIFFEDLSTIEHILLKDPAEVYPAMDPKSRSNYRAVIEKLSLKHKMEEKTIAEFCLELAVKGRDDLKCANHVGSYLIGHGYPLLVAKILNKPEPMNLQPKHNFKGLLYFISLYVTIFIAYCILIYILRRSKVTCGIYGELSFLAAALCIVIGIATDITNNIFARLIKVRELPALDYLKGIPDRARTFLVMPVIISSKKQALEYVSKLQRHYLTNRQSNLFFALLVDFKDSPAKELPEDKELENVLIEEINRLNALYPSEFNRFSLFVRFRKWNESEKCYMCWERKRGKLEEFNALLSGEKDTSYSIILCDENLLHTFKYVITLDSDSVLLKDNASMLVGIIDHPLNQPVIDYEKRRVKDGYAIIQPSITNNIQYKKNNLFYKVFAGKQGLDHYSTVISDIYHDIFDEGVFAGKGIYDIKAFHAIMNKNIPENSVLSHDLLESCYVKTAFSGAVKIMEDYPGNVISYALREHRWIRGDWQLLPWLFKKKTLAGLSKWKIFDNLRLSLVPLCKVLIIILNLALMPEIYYLWLPLVFFADIVSLFFILYGIISQKIRRPKLVIVYKDLLKDILQIIQRALLDIAFAPYRAYIAADAILRTLYRLIKSRRHLLMWNTAETTEKYALGTKTNYFLHMCSSLIPSAIIIKLLSSVEIPLTGMVLYGTLSAAWGLSYLIAYGISLPEDNSQKIISDENEKMLRETARRTWQFFKDFSTESNNWLCPDNYQSEPTEKVTDKTSPTNIGLQLLSVLSARDLGFETLNKTLEYIWKIFQSIERLPKWRGHLYNWYNIKTLDVLNPPYISTVDSGNFYAYMITLKNGLLELIDAPLLSPDLVFGLRDIIGLCGYDIELKNNYETIEEFINEITKIKGNINSQDHAHREGARFIGELNFSIDSILNEISDFEINGSFASVPTLRELVLKDNLHAKALMEKIESITKNIDIMFSNVDFRFLYNEKRKLFHIGYNLSSQKLDSGCYDLAASEFLLTSFLTVARNDVLVEHWYKLGRPLTIVDGIPCFVSWSGTMFEYLMPNLVMKEYKGSVFAETSRAAVIKQIKYAKRIGIPCWGISESQHYHFDQDSNYQYRAFGVPELRLQPSLSPTLVVAPYATIIALDYADKHCFSNLRKLAELGCTGYYGYYEAIDFNGPDPVAITPYSIVKSFMAHHQGMSLVSINNFIHNGVMKRRFHAEPIIKATEMLLEEKLASYFILISRKGYNIQLKKMDIPQEIPHKRHVSKVAPEMPIAHLLSNDNYSIMITSDGDGFSYYRDLMLYRWRSDIYACTGSYIFIKDIKSGRLWSSTYNPTKTEPDEYKVIFSPHQIEFNRRDDDVSSHTVVNLSPNHNLEVRKVTLTNHSNEKKLIELTSYMEVVMDSFSAEIAHPAFNKLFIESQFIEGHDIFLSKRRDGKDGKSPYLMHMVKSQLKLLRSIEYENDRLKFIGRNNTVRNPDTVVESRPMSNNAGFSNDPIISLRVNIDLEAESTASIYFITGVCSGKEEAIRIGEELNYIPQLEDINVKFRLQSALELKYLNISSSELNAFQNLISPIFYPSIYYRGPAENIRRNWGNQSDLWKFGISGDNPIMLLRVNSTEDVGIIKDVIKAYEYLRINEVNIDLVILSEAPYGYMQKLDDMLNEMTSSLKIYDEKREQPSLFILHTYQMTPTEVDLLLTVARVVFTDKTGIYFRNVKESF